MIKKSLFLTLICLAGTCGKIFALETSFITDPKTGKKAQVVKDQILVKYRKGTSAARKAALSLGLGTSRVKEISGAGIEVVKVGPQEYESALSRYKNMPEVESAQPNFVFHYHG